MNKNGNILTPPIPWYTVPGEGCWQDDVLDNDCHIVDLVKYQDHIVECVNSHDALTAENARLEAENAKMREALLIIAGGKEARGNDEEVAWHMAQLAAEAIAAQGGAK